MVEIEIDGKKLSALQGSMIIEVADANQISIPRFCYHKKLSVAANCRMCLVDVEKMPKPVPACATPVTPGMKISTQSPKVKDAQRAVMDFLLINHPLDCPICDQGGECELQDNALAYGGVNSAYSDTKRSIGDKNIGPLIQTALTRCIQCTRCVRFGQEVAGVRELGMTNRGENSEIATFLEKSLTSEVSANVIDLCPVGALVSKPFLYTARAWELMQHSGVATHDALGSNIYLHTRRDKILRVVPKENESINEVWLSDRDRFSYLGLDAADRLLSPMIKQNNQWHAVDWKTALDFAAKGFEQTKQKHGAESLLAISSPNATLEEFHLLQQMWKALGAKDLTSILRATDTRDFLNSPNAFFGINLSELEQQKSLFLIGCEIHQEIPLLGLRFRKAALNGATVHTLNPANYDFHFSTQSQLVENPSQWPNHLAGMLKILLEDQKNIPESLKALAELDLIKNATPSTQQKTLVTQLKENTPSFIYLGALAYHHPQAALIRQLVQALARLTQSQWGMHTDGCNSQGIANLQIGASSAVQALADYIHAPKHKGILLHNIDPLLDCANPYQVHQLLNQADFIVALTPYKNDQLLEQVDVLFPIGTLGETSGTLINLLSQAQNFQGCISPKGEARPAWKVLRVLANVLNLPDFTYTSTQDVLAELNIANASNADNASPQLSDQQLLQNIRNLSPPPIAPTGSLTRITQWPLYRVDNLVRASDALQICGSATVPAVYINESTSNQMGFKAGEMIMVQQLGRATLPIIIDNTLADKCVYIPAGFSETSLLGDNFGAISLSPLG